MNKTPWADPEHDVLADMKEASAGRWPIVNEAAAEAVKVDVIATGGTGAGGRRG